ncbi:MAG: type II toxin-antitoxin system RelE family toxin [Dehalococcoidia bacterium]
MNQWSDQALDQLNELAAKDFRTAKRVRQAISAHRDRGEGDVKKLQGMDGWRLRVGDWRVTFDRLPDGDLRIDAIVLRRDAYE